ncbi:MAG: c-type cytochrome [Deinococcota bacterium]
MLNYEKVNQYEFLWISFFLLMSVGHIVLIAYSLALEGPHIATQVTRAKPTELLEQGIFANPGVTYLERPNRAEVVGVAQAFAFSPAEIVLEKDVETTFYLTSRDVIHGYHVQGSNINAELIPGEVSTFQYTFNRTGEFRLACNQYCGIGHQNMLAKIIVVDDLDEYQTAQTASTTAMTTPATNTPAEAVSSTSDTTVTTPPADGEMLVSAAPSDWHDIGAQVYSNNCVSCHQATGQGIVGAFPPLAGHTPELVSVEGGREYLKNLVLYGLQGSIGVDGANYNGIMPAWSQLSDEQLASTLNYVLTEWGNEGSLPADFELFSAGELAEARGTQHTGIEVYDIRQQLGL